MSERVPYSDLVDVLQRSVVEHHARPLLGTKAGDRWEWISYGDFGRRVDDFRGGLAALGVKAGDTVAVIAGNRVEWAVAAYAAYGLGARFCPMYENQLEKEWKYILEDSGATIVLSATYAIHTTVSGWVGRLGALRASACMALPAEDAASFLAIEEKGKAASAPVVAIDPAWVCGFIYTSGTTGNPKGVLLTHDNIVSNLNAVAELFPVTEVDRSVSFLPWAHSFGQTCELHLMISKGAAMAVAESVEKLVNNFGEIQPTVLFSVPRIFNRIYDGLGKQIAAGSPVKRFLFNTGMANAVARDELAGRGESSFLRDLVHPFFDGVVFAKVRARLGGKLRYAVSGGAALSAEVAHFIDRLGIYVCEGYGLTETSPITSANHPKARKIGSVGQPIPGVRVVIDKSVVDEPGRDDGEIIVYGPNVMKGYHNLPEETRAVMTADGGFRTGDLGRLDDDGFLYITGRIKEQYKLQNGKYVVPAPLEELLQLSGFVQQAFVSGSNKLYNSALIVPDRVAVEGWAKAQGIAGEWPALLEDRKVLALFEREIDLHSQDFKSYERPKRFKLIPEPFSIENGMLTPKMSIKRRVVVERYAPELAELHADEG